MTREQKWQQFVEDYDIGVPEAKIENEMNLICMQMRQQMQYDMLTGKETHLIPEIELQQQKEEIRKQAIFEVKSQLVMKEVLNMHSFSVTKEELESEAEAIAKRQNTTVEMIKGFFGEDLAMLERDLLERKVLDWVYDRIDLETGPVSSSDGCFLW